MAITDGQPVNASASNAAWISKDTDDTATGVLTLDAAGSGDTIDNLQGSLNETMDACGLTGYQDPDANVYSSNNVVSNGDNRKIAIGKLDAEFDAATGHNHDGSPGSGGPIDINDTTGILEVGKGGTGISSYTAGDILYAVDSSTLAKLPIGTDGQVLTASGSGFPAWSDAQGGGGGGGIEWFADTTQSAIEDYEFGLKVWKFPDGAVYITQCRVIVPDSYVPGNQITMKVGVYSPSTSNNIAPYTNTYLVRPGVDAVNSTTNLHQGTDLISNGSPANRLADGEFELTDASGLINGVAVSPGDMLRIQFSRDYTTDTDTADMRMIPGTERLSFS